MRIINIVDRLDRVNFGIWNAAIATAGELQARHGVVSEVWFPAAGNEARESELNGARPRALPSTSRTQLESTLREAGLDPARDLIVSHGCWQFPTRWGLALRKRGFRWVAVPHGMLEAWSLSQKRIRKWLYFHLAERRYLHQADRIRAVGQPEFETLRKSFGSRVTWIPNGVPSLSRPLDPTAKPAGWNFLFMARLHHKKGLIPLVRAWLDSSLARRADCQLNIAGPDDGELPVLRALLEKPGEARNIRYLGAVYGQEKQAQLEQNHFYVLPSHSEGFPTSVLEAMQYGLVPLITSGCNFPDVFERSLGIRITPEAERIRQGLEEAMHLDRESWSRLAREAHALIESRYIYPQLADEQNSLYNELLPENG